MPVLAICEESALATAMPKWDEINLQWEEIGHLSNCWKVALSEWRVIYYIFDVSDGKGYVGSAYGDTNLLGRWQNYADSGHGGNSLLRVRDHRNFRFTILQRVSPDMTLRTSSAWKIVGKKDCIPALRSA